MEPDAPSVKALPKERRGDKSNDAGNGKYDDEAKRSKELFNERPELADPHRIKEDVEQAAVQIDGGNGRPPQSVAKNGLTARHAQLKAGFHTRR